MYFDRLRAWISTQVSSWGLRRRVTGISRLTERSLEPHNGVSSGPRGAARRTARYRIMVHTYTHAGGGGGGGGTTPFCTVGGVEE